MAEGTLGEIALFGGNFAPRNWALCDGQILPINSNQALFSLLGTMYGGDGRTTFALPDLRGRVPVGEGQGPGLTNRTLGSRGGEEQHQLTTNELPVHTHTTNTSGLNAALRGHAASMADATQPGPSNVLSTFSPMVLPYSSTDAPLAPVGGVNSSFTVPNTGGSQGHENRQPLLALNYIICISGLFPSRN